MKQLFAAKLEVRRLQKIYDAAAKLAANTINVTMTECSNLTATANGRPLETEEPIANKCAKSGHGGDRSQGRGIQSYQVRSGDNRDQMDQHVRWLLNFVKDKFVTEHLAMEVIQKASRSKRAQTDEEKKRKDEIKFKHQHAVVKAIEGHWKDKKKMTSMAIKTIGGVSFARFQATSFILSSEPDHNTEKWNRKTLQSVDAGCAPTLPSPLRSRISVAIGSRAIRIYSVGIAEAGPPGSKK